MATKFGVMVQLYSSGTFEEKDDVRIRLHNEVFETKQAAEEYINMARRQNMPFKGKWVIEFDDPRNAETL